MYDPYDFWERNAELWALRAHETAKDWEQIKGYIKPEWQVLELGCGDGRWSPYFKHYTGVDISPTLVIKASQRHPEKDFFYHDMRVDVPVAFDLIFTYTAWLHVPPHDILQVKLPQTNYLFIEPDDEPTAEYCFKHDYASLFNVIPLAKHGKLTIYGRFL